MMDHHIVVVALLLLAAASAAHAGVIGSVDEPYGFFCPAVNADTQSPLALVSGDADWVMRSANLQHSWLADPLNIDPTTGGLLMPGPVTVKLDETTIYLLVEPGLYNLTFQGSVYTMVQMHIHVPAEHMIDGLLPAMEIHAVHMDALGNLAVIGWLFKFGSASPFLDQLMTMVPQPTVQTGMQFTLGEILYPNGMPLDMIEFTEMELALAGSYYNYKGSLTTPPCSEGVTWLVLEDTWTLSVSREQIMAFQNIIFQASKGQTHANNRVPFPQNNRTVTRHVVSASGAMADLKRRIHTLVRDASLAANTTVTDAPPVDVPVQEALPSAAEPALPADATSPEIVNTYGMARRLLSSQ